jgi:hypothetical protein
MPSPPTARPPACPHGLGTAGSARRIDRPRATVHALLQNRSLIAYVAAFAGNTWEVFAVRVWFVAYLAWVLSLPGNRKVPLVYTNVAISNWHSFVNLGVSKIHCPGSFHSSIRLNPVANIGSYRAPRSPDEPILIQMVRTPCRPGLPERDQHRAGRAELLATSFGTFEEKIRDQLGRMRSRLAGREEPLTHHPDLVLDLALLQGSLLNKLVL